MLCDFLYHQDISKAELRQREFYRARAEKAMETRLANKLFAESHRDENINYTLCIHCLWVMERYAEDCQMGLCDSRVLDSRYEENEEAFNTLTKYIDVNDPDFEVFIHFLECKRDSRKHRLSRQRPRVEHIISDSIDRFGVIHSVFVTITFRQEILENHTIQEIRLIVKDLVKSQGWDLWKFNFDYGKKNGRLHIHALISGPINMSVFEENLGWVFPERVYGDSLHINYYTCKLTNHEMKENARPYSVSSKSLIHSEYTYKVPFAASRWVSDLSLRVLVTYNFMNERIYSYKIESFREFRYFLFDMYYHDGRLWTNPRPTKIDKSSKVYRPFDNEIGGF